MLYKNCIIIYIDKEPIACGAYKNMMKNHRNKKNVYQKKNIEEKDMLKMVLIAFRKMGKKKVTIFILETGVQQKFGGSSL